MTKLGRYEVEGELGRGSMGVVYLAHDPKIRRRVAVKTIAMPAGLSAAQRSEFRARFLREAQAAGCLTHPGIVTIYGVEEVAEQDLPFITMEYVAGRNLQHILQTEGRLIPERAFQMVMSLAEALQIAHNAGVIHRDLKPANILVRDKDGAVKITDFGVARAPLGDLTTGTGVLGSPSYMAPEQIQRGQADERSDLFALAVILYEAVTGKRLHPGGDLVTIAHKIVNQPVPSVTARFRGLPSSVDAFFAKALAKDPADRFPTAGAMAEALNEILLEIELDRLSASADESSFVIVDQESVVERGEPTRRWADRRILAAAGAGVVLFLLAILGVATMLGSRPEAVSAPEASPQPGAAAPPPETSGAPAERREEPLASQPTGASAAPAGAEVATEEAGGPAPRTKPVAQTPTREPDAAASAPPPRMPSEPSPVAARQPDSRPDPEVVAPAVPAAVGRGEPAGGSASGERPQPTEAAEAVDPAAAVGETVVADSETTILVGEGLGNAILPDTGSLMLVVLSRVKSGTLQVLVDGKERYRRDLAAGGKRIQRLLKKVTQQTKERVEEAIEIPAGAHTVTARLQIDGKAAVSEATIEIDLAADTTRTIEIVAGRKFGRGDALTLRSSD